MRHLPLLCLVLLAACGAAGDPVAPTKAAATPAVTISGELAVGISTGG